MRLHRAFLLVAAAVATTSAPSTHASVLGDPCASAEGITHLDAYITQLAMCWKRSVNAEDREKAMDRIAHGCTRDASLFKEQGWQSAKGSGARVFCHPMKDLEAVSPYDLEKAVRDTVERNLARVKVFTVIKDPETGNETEMPGVLHSGVIAYRVYIGGACDKKGQGKKGCLLVKFERKLSEEDDSTKKSNTKKRKGKKKVRDESDKPRKVPDTETIKAKDWQMTMVDDDSSSLDLKPRKGKDRVVKAREEGLVTQDELAEGDDDDHPWSGVKK
jgi:hypothetical protein